MRSDLRCPNCNIPLAAVREVTDDARCSDEVACNARRELLTEHGGAHLISPEGVARMSVVGDANQFIETNPGDHVSFTIAGLLSQIGDLHDILRGDGHRPAGTPSFHMKGCPGCAALTNTERAVAPSVPSYHHSAPTDQRPDSGNRTRASIQDLYTIQVMFDHEQYDAAPVRYHATINAAIREAEENLTDLLPAGYRARIRRWDHPEPDTYPGTRDTYCRRSPGCSKINGHPGPCSKHEEGNPDE